MREITFKPYKKQFKALQLLRDNVTNEVLYGGGARGAKSYLGCAWCLINAYAFPGSAGLIGRNELKRLKATTLITFYEVANSFNLKQGQDFNYNAQDSKITFKNGSMIFLIDLSYMPSDPNYDRLGSYGITYAFIDEAQEISEQAINVLKGRYSKLSGEGWKTIPKALYTCNPAKNWIYREFYLPYKNGTLRSDRAFVPSLVTDNPSIAPEYIENLRKADNVTVQRLLYGNFEYDDTPGRLFDYNAILNLWNNIEKTGEKLITIDVAREGKDKTVIMVWNGLVIEKIIEEAISRIDELTKTIRDLAQRENVQLRNIIADENGVGGGLIDNLRCQGFINNARPLESFRPNLSTKRNYENLKTQCYFYLARYVNEGQIKIIPECPKLIEELDIVVQIDMDKDGKEKIIRKEDIKAKLGRSPDYSDAMMMRMFYEIKKVESIEQEDQVIKDITDDEIFGRDEVVIEFEEEGAY